MTAERACHRQLVIELRADADQRVRRGAGTEPEDDGQPSVLERDRLDARGDGSSSQPADEAHANRPARRSAHMHHQLAPPQGLRDVDRWRRRRSAMACARPARAGRGTTTSVYAALAGLALPAALVSHTAMLQLPGPGTVTVAGPAAGADAGALHKPEPLAGQTW